MAQRAFCDLHALGRNLQTVAGGIVLPRFAIRHEEDRATSRMGA